MVMAARALLDASPEEEARWSRSGHRAARLRACGAALSAAVTVAGGLHVITGGLGGLGLRAAALLVASGV